MSINSAKSTTLEIAFITAIYETLCPAKSSTNFATQFTSEHPPNITALSYSVNSTY